MKQKANSEGLKNLKSTWEEKPRHDQKKTHQWLPSAGIKAETEEIILATQDQSLLTRNYQAKVMTNGAIQDAIYALKMGKSLAI